MPHGTSGGAPYWSGGKSGKCASCGKDCGSNECYSCYHRRTDPKIPVTTSEFDSMKKELKKKLKKHKKKIKKLQRKLDELSP